MYMIMELRVRIGNIGGCAFRIGEVQLTGVCTGCCMMLYPVMRTLQRHRSLVPCRFDFE